jgi:hypothetical protein
LSCSSIFFCRFMFVHAAIIMRLLVVGSGSVLKAGDALVLGAVGAAEDRAVLLDAVADHLAAAVRAGRGQRVDGTLEGVEGVRAAGHRHGERLV